MEAIKDIINYIDENAGGYKDSAPLMISKVRRQLQTLLNNVQDDDRSVATEDASSNVADNQKIPSKEIDWEGLVDNLVKKAKAHAKRHSYDFNEDSYTMGAQDVIERMRLETNLNNYLKTK